MAGHILDRAHCPQRMDPCEPPPQIRMHSGLTIRRGTPMGSVCLETHAVLRRGCAAGSEEGHSASDKVCLRQHVIERMCDASRRFEAVGSGSRTRRSADGAQVGRVAITAWAYDSAHGKRGRSFESCRMSHAWCPQLLLGSSDLVTCCTMGGGGGAFGVRPCGVCGPPVVSDLG